MKKIQYMKPLTRIVHLNIQDQVLDSKLGNNSNSLAGEDYEGDGQSSKDFTPDGWEDDSNSFNPWEN